MLKERGRSTLVLTSMPSVNQASTARSGPEISAAPSNADPGSSEMDEYQENIAQLEAAFDNSGYETGMNGSGGQIQEELEEQRTIFGCLAPPTPNKSQPDASMNLRAYAVFIANHTWFERFILFAILASAVHLALESPVKEFSSIDERTATAMDFTFLAIFLLEFIVKVLVHGVYWESKQAYFCVRTHALRGNGSPVHSPIRGTGI